MSPRPRNRNPLGQGAARQHPHRRTAHPARPATTPAEPAAENPLIQVLRPALRSDDPTAFWVAAAPLVTEIADLQHHSEELPEGVDLLDTFLEINVAETTALLHMVAAMCPDAELRSRARVGVTARRQPMPPQVSGLAQASVTEGVAFSDGAGENLMVELALPRGVRAVLIAYIPWSPAPYVKDAFVIGEPMEQVTDKYREIMANDGTSLDEVLEIVDPADARARFHQALASTAADVEQSRDWEQWPMLRPFVEFVVTLMPEGGTGYDQDGLGAGVSRDAARPVPERPPWLLEDGTDLIEEFTASEHAVGLAHGKALDDLVAYLMILLDAGFGDPLGWDPELTEWIVTDVLPTSPLLSEDAVTLIPSALPALIAWSLERTDEDPSVRARTLSAIAPVLEQFPARHADPRMRARRLEEQVDLALELEDPSALRLADLALRAGGVEALATLNTTPLPAEELALEQFPEELRDLAAEIDAHLIEGASALLEHHPGSADLNELLTACRRLLVRVAQLDDAVLRRKASTRNTAAAVVSIIARGNDLMGYAPAPLHEKDLRAAFDLRSAPSQRARTLAQAAALPHRFAGIALADPGLLLGSMRAKLLQERDVLQSE
ncbi:MAG: hypothetical protein ACTHV2_07655 [Brachybacterium sp.]|nr:MULTISPECIES: hypothetical protein [Brachybacterium]MDN6328514.1 hypothetical protein [Brachybacterium sp.]PCC34019.1 hypothetical protein CIK71_07095 [Brachybacterium alimentarium]RCS63880.1 hypothetical protein CIK73_15880 [Brachybacterium alimentarium]RCS65567.1 hypothetical protein CIK81_05070 [Brachybacterium sp. JB7]RCS74515.1 hypothetical protein CIK68_07215 [Brachybacterium alimentarium]